ncbi:MAG: hypothetical protein UT39_C0006G0047 [Candidatus Woesebacteria bacterium GW2011_GWA1_39_21]|uniref:VTT domain-containing protein n=1 Tax=Candidatus Woesebacteria bacterium GW2011_GWA1_39_21 TaxID=1618550 RepID=A0A0G0NFD5_9BACT|nr:MAG: hypothetical protein UT39_C0006G0047 [Candidatus Woesebacteria bacterium GW2011_GWA1_39_21]
MNLKFVFDFIFHLDKYLLTIIDQYGVLTHVFLFLIIFVETGFVITPFLPGDSIIFAAGTFSALGYFTLLPLFLNLFLAAVAGDTVNYFIGKKIGPKIFERDSRFIKKEHLLRTRLFYEKHGGKTIILARFIPIIRTFAPFVAGVGIMNYKRFVFFNIIGAFLWVGLFLSLGYFFGNIPFIKNNFEATILVIILISIIPISIEVIKSKTGKKS